MQLIFCKDNANERKRSLLLICRVQLIFCKDNFFFLIMSLSIAISFVQAYLQANKERIIRLFPALSYVILD
jgi:hypothetical protein